MESNGEAPDIIEPIERDSDGKLVRDKFGNAVGGLDLLTLISLLVLMMVIVL